jgi:alpha-L-rhamnosidase
MQKWAAAIGNTADANSYAALAANIKNAFNANFWNSSSHSYGSQQTANAVPLYHGMQPTGEEGNVFNALVTSIVNSNYHINCGQNGHGYMLQVLSRYGRDDLVARIHTNTTGPSFGYWVTQGKTNTPEQWDGGGSQQHQMNNVIPEWVCGSLAGISPGSPGFGEINIKPTCATTYVPDHVTCSLETVRGTVTADWTRSDSQYSLNVTIPANCSAMVYIPTFGRPGVTIGEGNTALWNNGTVVGTAEGVSYFGLEGAYPSSTNYVGFKAGSGTYRFGTPQGTGSVGSARVAAGPVLQQVNLFSLDGRLVRSFKVMGGGALKTRKEYSSLSRGIFVVTTKTIGSGETTVASRTMLLQ